MSTEPLILPQVPGRKGEINAELKLAESEKKVSKFLKNYKCKQMHSMMLLNKIPKGTSSLVRKSMVCKVKDCRMQIRNGQAYIHCIKCSDFYCFKHLPIRKVNDLDDLRMRLGFINKKLQLQNKIAAIIIIIEEEK